MAAVNALSSTIWQNSAAGGQQVSCENMLQRVSNIRRLTECLNVIKFWYAVSCSQPPTHNNLLTALVKTSASLVQQWFTGVSIHVHHRYSSDSQGSQSRYITGTAVMLISSQVSQSTCITGTAVMPISSQGSQSRYITGTAVMLISSQGSQSTLCSEKNTHFYFAAYFNKSYADI